MSRKQVSSATVKDWESLYGRKWEMKEGNGGVEMTQETLERIRHKDGIVLNGACEIRQKWYKSGITPRTYFSSGGIAYDKSKYIQEIAGCLTQQIETTHPITRLNPARIQLRKSSMYLRIYDLMGFTSNHWECKHFVQKLGEWCLGHFVNVVDAEHGVVEADLGELILEYNLTMNVKPSYTMERVLSEYSSELFFHNQAGFLGVYGNINFSTFLHGASLLMSLDNPDEGNVAGDDAHYAQEPGFEDIHDRIIDANGLLEPTKTFRSDQIGAVCLKRGVTQIDNQILPKPMVVFPSFSNLGALFRWYPPQFPQDRKSRIQCLETVGAELYRFMRAIFQTKISSDLEELYDLIHAIYISAKLPTQGSLPPYGEILIPALPMTAQGFIAIDPLDLLVRFHFRDVVILPKIQSLYEDDESRDPLLSSGSQWVGTSTKALRYLEVLEYVRKEETAEVLWGALAYNRIIDIYRNDCVKLYAFSCINDVPLVFQELVKETYGESQTFLAIDDISSHETEYDDNDP